MHKHLSFPFYYIAMTALHCFLFFISIIAGPQTRKPRHQPRLWAQGIHLCNASCVFVSRYFIPGVVLKIECSAQNDFWKSVITRPVASVWCVLWCASCQILDFGLARQADSEMTGYVVTRWYRAPEVILSWMRYTQTGNDQLIKAALSPSGLRAHHYYFHDSVPLV